MLSQLNVQVDLLHLDGGHDYGSVMADLQAWWPLVRRGGMLIGDDYNTNGVWPEVRQAFDEFFSQHRLTPFEIAPPKCRIRKPVQPRTYDVFGAQSDRAPLRRVTLGAPPTGHDDIWRPAEGTRMQRYRWMAGNQASWQVDVPAAPAAAFQAKIPFAFEAGPGTAAQSVIYIGDRQAEVRVRESAIFARLPDVPPGVISIELHTGKLEALAGISTKPTVGVAVKVIG
jgi:hypothetical protein